MKLILFLLMLLFSIGGYSQVRICKMPFPVLKVSGCNYANPLFSFDARVPGLTFENKLITPGCPTPPCNGCRKVRTFWGELIRLHFKSAFRNI